MLLTIVSFIFVFGIIVFSHEFGHYITARINDVKINEFSLGFGSAIYKRQIGETLYAVRALPIGGYVKMEGEDGESNDPRSLNNKKPLQRFAILVAGALMNFVLAYLLLVIIMFSIGYPSNTINEVMQDGPAYNAGIQGKDKIIEIDGKTISTWDEVVDGINNSGGNSMQIIVMRDNNIISFDLIPEYLDETNSYRIGISTLTQKNVIRSFEYAGRQFATFFTGIFKFFSQIGSKDVEGELVGPVGIVSVIGQASKQGILNLLYIAAYISINLGIVNLMPFPALDGGRIIFVLIEMILGRPLDREKEGYIHGVGFIMLMILMIFLIFKDISKF